VECHFTVTGFVVHEDRTLLHWHRRLQTWMPPGGHVEPDEDPVAALLREIREETGVAAEVVPAARRFPFDYPGQVAPPFTILIENSPEPEEPHQHIDLIYFCRSLDGARLQPPSADDVLVWVSADQLRRQDAIPLASCGVDIPVAEDVRVLALEAIDVVRRESTDPE
jgi:8-oxo-dGTP pyrophosphatase MutT (NUDIX family)